MMTKEARIPAPTVEHTNAHDLMMKNREDHIYRPARTLARATLAVLGVAGVAWFIGENAPRISPPWENQEADLNVHSIRIGENANLRENPVITESKSGDPSNVLISPSSELTVSTPSGAISYEDQNGRWYGISKEDLETGDPSLKDELSDDNDGIVWVNEQKVEISED